MAQNITIMGASYSDVPAVQLPKTGGGTARFDDASITMATASDVASGKVFLASDGTITTGTSSGGGGSSSWTKVAETSYQVSTTGTSAATVATWATGHSEIWTTEKIVHVRIRDTAGKRAGYFFGSDNYFYIPLVSFTSIMQGVHLNIRYTSNGDYEVVGTSTSTGYGVYADTVYNNGRIRIRQRYKTGTSLTIDGTYKVEVYLLDPVGGVSIFE